MIKRNILSKLQQELTQPEILILLGPRQVGKTTLLRILEDYAKQRGHKTIFLDLEQPQVLADFNRPDKEIEQDISYGDCRIHLATFEKFSTDFQIE